MWLFKYSAPACENGPTNNDVGYAGCSGYDDVDPRHGDPADAPYGNLNVPNAGYIGIPPDAPRSSWKSQAPST